MRWFERRFTFDLPIEAFPAVLERLRGTPARMEEKLRSTTRDILATRDGDAWSILEHAGHLGDLDELHISRLDDYLAGREVLSPADPENRRTWDSKYNARETAEVLAQFRQHRSRFVDRLEDWEPALLARSAFHPRLHQAMRVIDMAVFVADHDDHHLAVMTALARKFRATKF